MNKSFISSVKIIKLSCSGYYMTNMLFLAHYPLFLKTYLLDWCYWSRFDIWGNWDSKKLGQGLKASAVGGGKTATPWRCLMYILFGPFINIIVREHVYFIVTCSILVHPVFIEKWISLSLFIQDNKIFLKKAREQYWSDGGHPDCKRKCPWVNILSERHPLIKQTRNIPTAFKWV